MLKPSGLLTTLPTPVLSRVVRHLIYRVAPIRVLQVSKSRAIKPSCPYPGEADFLKGVLGWDGFRMNVTLHQMQNSADQKPHSELFQLNTSSGKHKTIYPSVRFQNTSARKHKIHISIKRKNRQLCLLV